METRPSERRFEQTFEWILLSFYAGLKLHYPNEKEMNLLRSNKYSEKILSYSVFSILRMHCGLMSLPLLAALILVRNRYRLNASHSNRSAFFGSRSQDSQELSLNIVRFLLAKLHARYE